MKKVFRSEKLLIKLAIKKKELIKITKSSKSTLIKTEMITRILIAALKAKQVIAIRFQVNQTNNLQIWGQSPNILSTKVN
jgi:hypothetical protein